MRRNDDGSWICLAYTGLNKEIYRTGLYIESLTRRENRQQVPYLVVGSSELIFLLGYLMRSENAESTDASSRVSDTV